MYGWNFHQGMAGGMNWADIIYRRLGRELEAIAKKYGSTIARAQADAGAKGLSL